MAFSRTIIMLGCLSLGIAPGDSQTPAASKPAPPACNAPLPDDDIVSFYRRLAATDKSRMLFEAAKNGAAGEVRALLAAGADLNAKDFDSGVGFTALHWAARFGHADVASCLLASGAEVDARNLFQETPLHVAAVNGHTPVVRLLVAAGADPNARTLEEDTPLRYAAQGCTCFYLKPAILCEYDLLRERGHVKLKFLGSAR